LRSKIADADDATPLVLDGSSLTVDEVIAILPGNVSLSVPEEALRALDDVRSRLLSARSSGRVYGANTGVGANRTMAVGAGPGREDERAAHARRLLLSHCVGAGPLEDDSTVRAAMVIRLNQFLAGGSGISSTVARGLLEALASGSIATIHRLGNLGTGDLAGLAELALTLSGDRPWRSGGIAPVTFADSDSLPFLSSSALTLAAGCQGVDALKHLLEGVLVVASLSILALEGSPQPYAEAVHGAIQRPHQAGVAAAIRRLLGPDGVAEPARLQDPFAVRALPQVHAPALDAAERLRTLLEGELNGSAENPLVTTDGVLHHGQFHLAMMAAVLDATRTGLYPVISLSAARLSHLFRPELSHLPPFLAAGAPGSSGLMITEYVAQDVLSTLRTAAAPVSGAGVSVSLGLEEHASFAAQAARLLRDMTADAPVVVALEAIAAVRALRMAPGRLGGGPAREAFEYLAAGLDPDMGDRPIDADLERALALLPGLGRFLG